MKLTAGQVFIILLVIAAVAFGLRSRELLYNLYDMSGDPIFARAAQNDDPRMAFDENSPRVNDLMFAPSAERLARIQPSAENEHEDEGDHEEDSHGDDGHGDAHGEEGPKDMSLKVDPPKIGAEEMDDPASSDKEWKDSDSALELSPARMELFEDLAARRKELEQREKELAMREALLQAAEKEIDQKYEELSSLKTDIESLLSRQSAEEEEQIMKLVKIYEGMKAKQAASIFNTLETDVLLAVLGRMSERKSAPIIAAMNPERARSITILLADQKALPDLSAQ